MTRKEEIEKTANEFYKGDEVSTFVVAAQWADKTMIDKACKCIIKLHNWPTQYEEFARFQEEFITAFRKAMEE